MNSSPRFTLNKTQWIMAGQIFLYFFVGTLITGLIQYLSTINFGQYQFVSDAFLGALTFVGHMFFTGQSTNIIASGSTDLQDKSAN